MTIYPITKWTQYEVVAAKELGCFGCSSVTITITRKSERALWVDATTGECLRITVPQTIGY